ncbi:MAG: extracellular solute-binding protein [bacterium]|nr:extracellular solute-binding protein [bacterium]
MYLNLVRQFNQDHKDAAVQSIPMDNYNEVLETVPALHQQGVGGWVAVVEVSELMTLKDAGAVLSLDALIAAEPEGREIFLQRFFPEFLANCRGNEGNYYALPFYRSTPIIYYNLDLLRQAGADVNRLPKTWDELEALLDLLKASTQRPPFGLAPTWHEWIFEAFVRQNGGALANESNTQVLFDHPKTIEALGFWKRLKDKGLLEQFPRTWKATLKSFALQQRYPIIYYSTGGMEFVNQQAAFAWATDIMPKNTTFGTPVGGANIFISSLNTPAQQQVACMYRHSYK